MHIKLLPGSLISTRNYTRAWEVEGTTAVEKGWIKYSLISLCDKAPT